MKLRVAGIDPSLRNFGLVRGYIDLDDEAMPFIIEAMLLVESDADKANKKTVRKNSDDLRRARSLQREMTKFIADVAMVFVEVPVGSQSARSMASYGICIGVLSSIKRPMIQVTPTEVKLAAVGIKTASKEQMIAWAHESYPDANWMTRQLKGETVLINKNEHLADAIGTVHAGMLTDQFINAVGILAA